MAAIDTPTAPPAPTTNDTAVVPDGDQITHAYCARCWSDGVEPLTATCGFQPPERPARPAGPHDQRCVVCVDLMWSHTCERCGR